MWLTESWPVGLLGNIEQNSHMTLIGGAFDHGSHAPQLRSCNNYVHTLHIHNCQHVALYISTSIEVVSKSISRLTIALHHLGV